MVVWETLRHALVITSFVAVMMLLVEYLNVFTSGTWQAALAGSRLTQYLAAVLLGATPGCLGAFVIVTLYIHRTVSLGAVVACMIATSGDESFVMLAMFPVKAGMLMLALAIVGLCVGMVTDFIVRHRGVLAGQHELVIHEDREECQCFNRAGVLGQLRHLTAQRGVLGIGHALFLVAIIAGFLGPPAWSWVRVTLLLTGVFALFVVVTVPEHFLKEHLWRHVIQQHVPRIFAWTFAAMVVIAVLARNVEAEGFLNDNPWMMLGLASFLGIVPESGPHLLIVTLHDRGSAPMSVLMASSIVQDGHGMLPLFAHSWHEFLKVKGINLIAGILVGALLLVFGW